MMPTPTPTHTPTHTSAGFYAEFHDKSDEDLVGTDVVLAGRVLFRNHVGPAVFLRVGNDPTADAPGGTTQLYVRGDDVVKTARTFDIGDRVCARGSAMRTRSGELSLRVAECVLLEVHQGSDSDVFKRGDVLSPAAADVILGEIAKDPERARRIIAAAVESV